ncbi:50S ribosomal protein L29 [Candidatus Gottesmanbacteria bacterium]|nr:50S ribosomal protein L29 [Candidatus Gottesmanbacteria bacterium]
MKKKEKDQIHALSVEELCKEIAETTKKLSDRSIAKKGSSNRNVKDAKALRIKRAILLTVLREKELSV